MSKFIVKDDFLKIFPDVEIAVLIAKGINNKDINENSDEEIEYALDEANEDIDKFFTTAVFSENEVIAVWRDAYKKFKTKKGARSSIENLLKRVNKGNPVRRINPIVDIYNAISLKYGLPCGGEDLDTIKGDLLLTMANGGEPFIALGDDEPDNALPGEVIYKDDKGAVCRCWNWKDGKRTMLTEDTQNAFLIIESVNPKMHDTMVLAMEELKASVEKHLGGKAEIKYIDRGNKEVEL
ncbi:MAG TPA: B3/4 domain-containing protein [Anaerovoracaceae bacterium]|nr:B3/4 domain-containing protein [Anaerovoracaceae bacterium]